VVPFFRSGLPHTLTIKPEPKSLNLKLNPQPVPSPWDSFFGLSPPKKAPISHKLKYETILYKSVDLLSFLECQDPRTKVKLPYLILSGGCSALNLKLSSYKPKPEPSS